MVLKNIFLAILTFILVNPGVSSGQRDKKYQYIPRQFLMNVTSVREILRQTRGND